MKRSVEMAKTLGLLGFPAPTPTSMYRSAYPKLRFLLSEGVYYGKFMGWDRLNGLK